MLSGIRERKEQRKTSEGTEELPYSEVFRKGFVFLCSPSSSLRITKKFEICIFYFLTVHIVLTEAGNVPLISLTGLIFYIPSYCQNMCWRSHPHFFFSENVSIVLTHWQKNYTHQVINLGCQQCPQPSALQDVMKSSCIDFSV